MSRYHWTIILRIVKKIINSRNQFMYFYSYIRHHAPNYALCFITSLSTSSVTRYIYLIDLLKSIAK